MKIIGAAILLFLMLPGVQAGYTDGIFNYSASLTPAGYVATITSYIGTSYHVTVPATFNGWPVIGIGDSAFSGNLNVTNITLGTNVTTIGNNAFAGCRKLPGIVFPDSVVAVGNQAFIGCVALANIAIPAGVASIGDGPFANCRSLSSITVDENNPAYAGVSGVLFNKNLTVIIQCPGGSKGQYVIPESVKSIADYAFNNCVSLTNIIFSDGLTNIGNFGVSSCVALVGVTIPDSVVSIGTNAFYLCAGLTNVSIPAGLTGIRVGALANCTNLTAITVDANNPAYAGLDGVLFDRSLTTLLQYPAGKKGAYQVPAGVSVIAPYSFFYASGLTCVGFPPGLGAIGQWAFGDCFSLTNVIFPASLAFLDYEAFFNCSQLSEIYFQGDAPSANPQVFTADNATVYYLPGTHGWTSTFSQILTAPWYLPASLVLNSSLQRGSQTNAFSFAISWATNGAVVVEASADLVKPNWQPVQTNLLETGSAIFADPDWTNHPARFYRIRSP